MTEPPTPSDRDDVDARIGAWLSGELADDEAEAFTAQLAADAELAARVEAVRATRERLAGAASEAPPQGFTQRVAAAVAAEADQAAEAGEADQAAEAGEADQMAEAGEASEAAAAPGETTPVSLEAARARRERRRRRVVAVGSVAAALIAVAVIVPTVSWWGQQADQGAETAGVAQDGGDAGNAGNDRDAADTAASEPQDNDALEDEAATTGQEDTAADAPEARTPQPTDAAPVLVQRRAAFAETDRLIAHFRDREEATGLLGLPADDAASLAEHTASVLRRTETPLGGAPADACVAEITNAFQGPVVFARLQPVRLDDSSALAHLLVTAAADQPLTRVTLQVRRPSAGCAVVLSQRL
jgi:negative regulator of sigma E activity